MQLDVVTLFPEWFDWFRTQRHVRNALRGGATSCGRSTRATTRRCGRPGRRHARSAAARAWSCASTSWTRRCAPSTGPTRSSCARERRVIALIPGGRSLDDRYVDELAAEPAITLLCGRYEGFDERIVQHFAPTRCRIGRYVLAGRRAGGDGRRRRRAAQAARRARPRGVGGRGVLLRRRSSGNPEYPHYTRPAEYRGWTVPDVLLSGHHAEIRTLAPGAQPRARRAEAVSAGPERFATIGRRRAARPSRLLQPSSRARPLLMSTVIDIPRARAAAPRPVLPGRRPRPRPLPGHRGHASPYAGLRGRRDQAPGPRRPRDVHRPQAVLRRRRGAHVPRALAEDRADRGRRPR